MDIYFIWILINYLNGAAPLLDEIEGRPIFAFDKNYRPPSEVVGVLAQQ